MPEDSSFSAVDFREQCRNALSVLKPDAFMDEKAAVAHALIEKVESNSPTKKTDHFDIFRIASPISP